MAPISAGRATLPAPPSEGGLSVRAWLYLCTVVSLAIAGSSLALSRGDAIDTGAWRSFAIIAAAAGLFHLFPVLTPRNQSYHTTMVVLVPAVLVLPPELLLLVAVAQHLPEWVKARYPWYIQTFNIANYAVDLLAAYALSHALLGWEGLPGGETLQFALAGLAAAIALVASNHFLLALMLKLGRGHSLRDSSLFAVESLSTDLVVALLGVVVAYTWQFNPWLVPFVLSAIALVHRSLAVPQLQAEARVDAKTGLYNTRFFSEALGDAFEQATRSGGSLSVLMIDLDLLRDLNNTYGHLAGDAVLEGVAATLRRQLRAGDIPSRFGGEEFALLLPGATRQQAVEVAERIRAAIANERFVAPTADAELRATVSIGVAAFPAHATDPDGLLHQADIAVYRAKIQGRNRVVEAGADPLVLARSATAPGATLREGGPHVEVLPAAPQVPAPGERRAQRRPWRRLPPTGVARHASVLGVVGLAAGAAALVLDPPHDTVGLLAVIGLVACGQAMALRAESGSISIGAVGSLAGVALFGPGVALLLALTSASVDWLQRRTPVHKALFNLGVVTLAGLAAACALALAPDWQGSVGLALAGLVAGGLYFVLNTGLLSLVIGLEEGERPESVWGDRYLWLLPHYVTYGFVGAVVAIVYDAAHLYAIAVFAVPLILMRATQESYVRRSADNAEQLLEATRTIRLQNVSLAEANQLLLDRSMAALEGLSATVDARDAYTAGHSRRVRAFALEIGRELGLSAQELEVLGHAALFHDIGKLAVPDAILLKPALLDEREMAAMRRHAEEGAGIVSRLGFLADAVPAILHHHERFDGTGYPDGLAGNDIPLGARVVHVADALDSMMTTRIYRRGWTLEAAVEELQRESGRQFCPLCVEAALRVLSRRGDLPSDVRERMECVA